MNLLNVILCFFRGHVWRRYEDQILFGHSCARCGKIVPQKFRRRFCA
jgi:hypothetical protein